MQRLIVFCLALAWMPIGEAHAYIGPGLGLGAVGVALGLFLTVVLAVVGLVWYPLKRLVRKVAPRDGRRDAPADGLADARDDVAR